MLADLTPTGRTLYWYLRATGGGPVEVAAASAESGIPLSSVYMAVRKHPDHFQLYGTTLQARQAQTIHVAPTQPSSTTAN